MRAERRHAGRAALAGLAGMVALSVLAASSRADGLEVPELHETTLQNGLRVVLIEKPTVPMITIEAWIEAGAIADTPETSGLAALTVESIRKGAGDLDAAAFASTLDGLGARFSTSITAEAARVHLDLLAADAAHGLDLVADALLRPRFDEEEVTRLAAQLADAIRERKDTPRLVLRDYHLAHVYGDHPLGNPVQGTESTLPRLGADDVRDFHRGHYGADRTLLVVAGDLDATAMLAEVRARFDAMPLAEAPRAALPPEPIDPGPRVLVVNDLDTPQSAFMIGAPGPGWDSPDLPAVMVVRTLFGGRFTSRLNTALRIESGLTYSASYTMERYRSTGWGAIYSFTATETTEEAITRALAELDRLHEEGISEEELASAKAYILGQTPYEYETADDLAGAVAELVFMGRGRAYLDELFARVDAVTVADCEKAIEREFSRDGMVITVAGRGDEIESALAGLGPVARRENRDPGFALR